jgi:hypothetical protein
MRMAGKVRNRNQALSLLYEEEDSHERQSEDDGDKNEEPKPLFWPMSGS